jgi:catecholate siderophore receptor
VTRRLLEKVTTGIVAACALVGALTGAADAAVREDAAVLQTTFRFDIPAGALADVLAAFQTLTGLTVAAPAHTTIQGLTSPGVEGTFTPEQALTRALTGTGLTFRLAAANGYSLEVRPVIESVEVRGSLPYRAATTVTATRTLTPLHDVPQAVTVITRAMIADQRMQNMADVMRYVPGAGMAQGEGNRDTPVLRGTSTTADFFVDGVRDDVQYFRDLYNVDSVEALKGPNAMIFGRGGPGGVINRTTRQADWSTAREITLQGGSFDNRRATFDVGQPMGAGWSARLTGVYENSGSYRRGVDLERYGINPTLAFMVTGSTTARVGYERFHDDRTADRGIPSFGTRPAPGDASVFFGDPGMSNTFVTVDAFTAGLEHAFRGGVLVRNRTRVAAYDKFYQNVYASGAVGSDGSTVPIAAYNNGTERRNFFNQTDVNFSATTGRVRHTVLIGAEVGRQATDNIRHTGYFTGISPTATSYSTRLSDPIVSVPITFRQSATDADNHGVAAVGAAYAQDQVDWSPQVQTIVGLRYDRFDMNFRNNRTAQNLSSLDHLVSPRAGVVYKPVAALALYASYSLAYVPRAGEQLSSLSLTNQALEPERFVNYEVGAKWETRPEVAVTAAIYKLDRTNVAIPDPVDTTRSLLVAGQRTRGFELGVTGSVTPAWTTVAAYAYQDGRITQTISATARAGAVLAQVPAHTFSLWNKYNVSRRWGVGAGIIHNGDMFTSTDNTVVLPAFTRVDAAVFMTLTRQLRAQLNVENLLDERYYPFSNGNNNITPGSPRALRLSLTTNF